MSLRSVLVLLLYLITEMSVAQVVPPGSNFNGKVKSVQDLSWMCRERSGTYRKAPFRRNGDLPLNYKVTYNPNGLTSEIIIYSHNLSVMTRTEYVYDSMNILITQINFNRNRVVTDSTTYHNYYDSTGKLIKRISWHSTDEHCDTYTYTYEPNGEICEWFLRKSEHGDQQYLIRIYDPHWKVKSEYWYNGNKYRLIQKTVYTYDEADRLQNDSVFYRNMRRPAYIEQMEYDSIGNLVSMFVNSRDWQPGKKWTYKYKFDAHGNWIERIDLRNGRAFMMHERKIEYY